MVNARTPPPQPRPDLDSNTTAVPVGYCSHCWLAPRWWRQQEAQLSVQRLSWQRLPGKRRNPSFEWTGCRTYRHRWTAGRLSSSSRARGTGRVPAWRTNGDSYPSGDGLCTSRTRGLRLFCGIPRCRMLPAGTEPWGNIVKISLLYNTLINSSTPKLKKYILPTSWREIFEWGSENWYNNDL